MSRSSQDLVRRPSLDIIANDPILSPSLPTSPSRSRPGGPTISFLEEGPVDGHTDLSESQPLLDSEDRRNERKKPFYRPRPMWIVPFAVLASISRGMTIAPRVEVFTQLACYATYGHPHYNHSTSTLGLSLTPSPLDLSRAGTIETIFLRTSETNEDGNDDDDDTGDEDPLRVPSKRCLSDPAVQSYAARLQTIMTTTMGLLSALTTGWWGHFGERHGRTRVLAAATMGLLLTDVFFVLVSLPRSPLAAHGHKLLVISPIIEGLLGGWTTLQSGTSAYISDCTSDGSRAHIFSRFMGVFYFGFAIGPMLGAWVITHPPAFLLPLLRFESASEGRTVTPVFWLAVCFSFTNLLLSLFVFPESLGKKKRAVGTDLDPLVVDESEDHRKASKNSCGGILSVMKGLFMPLVIFAPKIRPNGRDWNMTLLALAFFGYLLSSGIFQLKYLYAEHVFAWEAEQLSYYITFVGGARAVHLLFVMPFIISCCKPKPKKTSTQLQGTASNKKPKPTKAQLIAEMKFDLRITRLSYAIDVLSHTLVSLSSTSSTAAAQAAFVGFTVLSSFGSGVVPSMQSLSLCVMQTEAAEDERLGVAKPAGAAATGSLFGALAVLQATGQMILGPLLFGLVYSTTVAQFPKGIFVLAASILAVSLLLLVRVHPLRSAAEMRKQARVRKKYGYPWDGPEVERGRSRVSKDLSGASLSNGSPNRGAGTSSSGALVYGSI